MKKHTKIATVTLAAITLLLSGCGSDNSSSTETLDLESAKKVLYFYGAGSNEQYAYFVETNTVENLNDDNVTAMDASKNGSLFYFLDDLGDANASNDVDKVLMFNASYSFANDGNATWENFYYLDHLHDGEHHPHANDEFDVTSGGKFDTMIRLNKYLAEQEQLKSDLKSSIADESIVGVGQTSPDICNFYTVTHADDNEVHYYVLGTNGSAYTFDDTATNFRDVTLVSSAGCEIGKSGMVAAEDGVLIYLGSTSTVYLLDAHKDGVSHIHSQWDISELLGDTNAIEMMVGIGALEHDGDDHDHDHE